MRNEQKVLKFKISPSPSLANEAANAAVRFDHQCKAFLAKQGERVKRRVFKVNRLPLELICIRVFKCTCFVYILPAIYVNDDDAFCL